MMLQHELSRVASALYAINSEERWTWVTCGMALKSAFGDVGWELWDDWSRQADNYKAQDARNVWRSFRSGNIGLGTVFYHAMRAGWRPEANELVRRQKNVVDKWSSQKKVDLDNRLVQKKSRQFVQRFWNSLDVANPEHPYLRAKKILPHCARRFFDQLVIPISLGGELVSCQEIGADGRKSFFKGGQISGASVQLGPVLEAVDYCYIAEGFATGATVQEVTGQPVFCAMTASNLRRVALRVRQENPQAHIVIAADNDRFTRGNPGKTAAYAAAEAVGAEVLLPVFPRNEAGVDWNDFFLMELRQNEVAQWRLQK